MFMYLKNSVLGRLKRLPAFRSTRLTTLMMESAPAKKSKFTYRHLQQLSKYSVDSPLRVIALVWVIPSILGFSRLRLIGTLMHFMLVHDIDVERNLPSIDGVYLGPMWDEKVGSPGRAAIGCSAVAECVVFDSILNLKFCGSNSGQI